MQILSVSPMTKHGYSAGKTVLLHGITRGSLVSNPLVGMHSM